MSVLDLRLVEVIRANKPIKDTVLAVRVTGEELIVKISMGHSSDKVALSTIPRKHFMLALVEARVMRPLADSPLRVMERIDLNRGMVDRVMNPRAEARLPVITTNKVHLVRGSLEVACM